MRFAITAFDMYQGIFETFLQQGWTPVKLFTFPIPQPNRFSDNRNVIALASQLRIPIQMSRMDEHDLQDLAERGCDVLVGAGYSWRILDWSKWLRHGINFHPSPLPEARGRYPFVTALLQERSEWAVSCHKLAPEFDTGDILAQEFFPIAPNECHETLVIKTQMANKRLAKRVAANLPALWDKAQPQGPGTYWNEPGQQERTLDLAAPVEQIMRRIDAFGLWETYVIVDDKRIAVHRAAAWTEAHDLAPGTIAHGNERDLVLAVADGYLALLEWRVAG